MNKLESSQSFSLTASITTVSQVTQKKKELLLIGGGHSQLFVLEAFAHDPEAKVNITLVSPQRHTPYSGALSACLAGFIPQNKLFIDLSALAKKANATFIQAELSSVDTEEQLIHLSNHSSLAYDYLSLNTGSLPQAGLITGAEENTVGVKPIENFLQRWNVIQAQCGESLTTPIKIGFIGAGVAGCELAITITNTLKNTLLEQKGDPDLIQVHLFADNPEPCPALPESFRKKVLKAFNDSGVYFHPEEAVTEIQKQILVTNNSQYKFDEIFLTTTAQAPAWAKESGIETDINGFIVVNESLQSTSHPNIFATGDIATMKNSPRPKSGVFAVRQGKPLAYNLRMVLQNKPLQSYKPQSKALVLMSTGRKNVLATRGNWSAQGRVWWWLKNALDENFLKRFNQNP